MRGRRDRGDTRIIVRPPRVSASKRSCAASPDVRFVIVPTRVVCRVIRSGRSTREPAWSAFAWCESAGRLSAAAA